MNRHLGRCIGDPCVICWPDEYARIKGELPLLYAKDRFNELKMDKLVRLIQERMSEHRSV